MSNPQWMYSSDGEGFGPFTETQLKQLIAAGLVSENDRVWKEGDTESQSAASFISPLPHPKGRRVTPPFQRKGLWISLLLTGAIALVLGLVTDIGSWLRGLPVDEDVSVNVAHSGTTATENSLATASLNVADATDVASNEMPLAVNDTTQRDSTAGSKPTVSTNGMTDEGSHKPAETSMVASDPWPVDALEFKGHRYKFYEEQVSWKQAKQKCENMSGQLVVIESAEENKFVTALVVDANWKEAWIGATDEDTEGLWKWVGGGSVNGGYTKWFPKQPNNKKGVEHYMVLWAIRDGQWVDQPNYSHQHRPGIICEWVGSKSGK
ncbi:lectin-like protein [Novipirellula sp. SH528]|uniref:lectin-like protein n=1 Tax=Novipirellula sp. SH528 TaxID=3454466 RepID=UPI003FA11A81